MSFVAASTDAVACVCPSSEPTRVTWIFFASPTCFSAAFCRPMPTLTAWSRFAPYAASPPVNGSTSPIRSVNPQLFDACAVRDVPADPTDVAVAAVATTITVAASALNPFLLTIPPLRRSMECPTLTDLRLVRKETSRQCPEDVRGDRRSPALDLQLRQRLDDRALRQLLECCSADHDAARGCLALEPGPEVDRVAEDSVDAVAALADDP